MTATETLAPVIVAPGESRLPEPIRTHGNELLAKVTGADSGGAFSVALAKIPPMGGPPLHMHTREDEWFYVLKGELTFQVGDKRFTAGPGTSVFGPREIPHAFRNFTDSEVEMLGLVTPAAFENFLIESARTPRDEMEALGKRYGTVMLGPPIER